MPFSLTAQGGKVSKKQLYIFLFTSLFLFGILFFRIETLISSNALLENQIQSIQNNNRQLLSKVHHLQSENFILKSNFNDIRNDLSLIHDYFNGKASFDPNQLTAPSHLTYDDYVMLLRNTKYDPKIAKQLVLADTKHNINGIIMLSLASLESAYGNSFLAKHFNNITSYRAYDQNPLLNAKVYNSQSECIEDTVILLKEEYLSSSGKYFNGLSLKSVNKKYASDKRWAHKIESIAKKYTSLLY